MNDDFLRETIDKVLDGAVEAIHELIEVAQQILEDIDEELDEWAEDLYVAAHAEADTKTTAGGRDNNPSQEEKYQYIVTHADEHEKDLLRHSREYLMSESGQSTLDSLYKTRVQNINPTKNTPEQ